MSTCVKPLLSLLDKNNLDKYIKIWKKILISRGYVYIKVDFIRDMLVYILNVVNWWWLTLMMPFILLVKSCGWSVKVANENYQSFILLNLNIYKLFTNSSLSKVQTDINDPCIGKRGLMHMRKVGSLISQCSPHKG